jgi:hypothetical protein
LAWGFNDLLSLLKPNGDGLASLKRYDYQAPAPSTGVRLAASLPAGLESVLDASNGAT